MRKKIAIITLVGNFNYGNRLQNYALQQVIENLGCSVVTFNIRQDITRTRLTKIKEHCVRLIQYPSTISHYFKQKEYDVNYAKMADLKSPILLPFTEKFIKYKEVNESSLSSIQKEYDYFIVGSDQVWNLTSFSTTTNFLQFADKGKRISYAASFGKSSIAVEDRRFFKKMINDMDKISVREDAGKRIVNDLTNKEVRVHVDPTMLLSKIEWLDMVECTEKIKDYSKPYILVYALRGMSEELQKSVNNLASEENLCIRYIMGDFIQDESEILSVPQFVKAINEATLVVTDSFHGTVFSIIMNTPFEVLQRTTGNMNSRIDTLLKKFNFEKNIEGSEVSLKEIISETDFTHVKSILDTEKEKSYNYLKEVLR